MAGLEMSLRAKSVFISGRTAVVALPRVGEGRSFRVDYALPGEPLGNVVEFAHGVRGRVVGEVVAVRPAPTGTHVEIRLNDDSTRRRLRNPDARVDVAVTFEGSDRANPYGGKVLRVEVD